MRWFPRISSLILKSTLIEYKWERVMSIIIQLLRAKTHLYNRYILELLGDLMLAGVGDFVGHALRKVWIQFPFVQVPISCRILFSLFHIDPYLILFRKKILIPYFSIGLCTTCPSNLGVFEVDHRNRVELIQPNLYMEVEQICWVI